MAVPRASETVVAAMVAEGTFSGAVGLATVATESAVEGSVTAVAGLGAVAEAVAVSEAVAVAAAVAVAVAAVATVVEATVVGMGVEAMARAVVLTAAVLVAAILVALLNRQADQKGQTGQRTGRCDQCRGGLQRRM